MKKILNLKGFGRIYQISITKPKHVESFNFLKHFSSKKFPFYTVIKMPALSPTMSQGNIISWKKNVGEELQPGDQIAEIETDKATMDFEFQEEGFLAKILVKEGTSDVPVGKPIAIYTETKDNLEEFDEFTEQNIENMRQDQNNNNEKNKSEENKESNELKTTKKKNSVSNETKENFSKDFVRIIASPLCKSIALDKGISLKKVKGTGPNGRIIAKDLENYKQAFSESQPDQKFYNDIPISNIRLVIANRLVQSSNESPSYFIQSQISCLKLSKLRQSLNLVADNKYKISINDMLIKAIAVAVLRVPQVNSSWMSNENVIRVYKNVDVSVAVTSDRGLITPILKNADIKSLAIISNEMKDLIKRAKDGKLKHDEYQGGTICISNLGMNNAVNNFTSIINPPHSTIVSVGKIDKKAVPTNVNDMGFIFDDIMTINATFDHRTVDGSVGADWVKELKRVIENPLEFML